jgi:hypothetical protein
MKDQSDSSQAVPTMAEHCEARRNCFPENIRKTFSTRPWGIALSGGGIRSATFCFGLIKALSKNKIFHRFDILSTVSGGGYIGSAMGKLFYNTKMQPNPIAVEKALGDAETRWFAVWLRSNGRYLIPGGTKDILFAAANFGRNLLAIHIELAFLSIIMGCLLVGGDLLVWQWADQIFSQRDSLQPTDGMIALLKFLSQWPTVWLLLLPLVWGSIVLACTYWVLPIRKQKNFTISIQNYSTLLIAILGTLILIRHTTHVLDNTIIPKLTGEIKLPVELVYVLLSVCVAWFLGVILSVVLSIRKDKDLDWARNKLTTGLSLMLRMALAVAVVGAADYIAWSLGNSSTQGTFGGILALIAIAFRIALPKISDLPKSLVTSTRRIMLETVNIAGIISLGLLIIFWMSLVHRITSDALFSERPAGLMFLAAWQSLGWLFFPPLLLVVISSRNRDFLNRSSLYTFYRARLVRSYLGAGNSQRFKSSVNGSTDCLSPVQNDSSFTDVTDVQPGDDIPMADYQPHLSGGPVHLINVCINQTRDSKGGLFNQDRKGTLMTVGPNEQVSIFKDKWYRSASAAALSLGSWMAISGAAVAPGLGSSTRSGISALLMMSGIRLGYWWDSSNLTSDAKVVKKPLGKYKQFWSELCGRFDIDCRREWFLSDGGHFENTGAYALLREECEVIVVADCGADPRYSFGDLENLVRKARIDLQAIITFLRPKKPDPNLSPAFGSLNELASSESEACLAIARIDYMHSNTTGYMIIVKPNMCHRAPVDLVNFKAENPLFPQEPTTDQFFSEAQWESYFHLGQTLGSNICLNQLTNVNNFASTYFTDDDGAIIIKNSNGVQSLQYPSKRLSSRIVSTGAVSASISIGAFASIGLAGWQAINSELDHQSRALSIEPTVLKELSDLFGTLPTPGKSDSVMSDSKIGQMATALLRVGDSTCNAKNLSAFRRSDFINLMVSKTREACKITHSSHPSCERLLIDDNLSPCLQQKPREVCQHMYWTRDYNTAFTQKDTNCWQDVQAPVNNSTAANSTTSKVGEFTLSPTHNTIPNTTKLKCKGQIIYLQIYGPELRDAARLFRKPWREMGASVPPVEDILDTSRRSGRRPPQPYPIPTVIYHNANALACASALQPPGSEPRWQVQSLSTSLSATQGVIEVWLPPGTVKPW